MGLWWALPPAGNRPVGKREPSSVCLSLGRRACIPPRKHKGQGLRGSCPLLCSFGRSTETTSSVLPAGCPLGPGGCTPGVLVLTAHTGLEADTLPQSSVDSVVAEGGLQALGGGGT